MLYAGVSPTAMRPRRVVSQVDSTGQANLLYSGTSPPSGP